MGIIAITVVLTGSLAVFLLGLTTRIVLRKEGKKYTDFADSVILASLLAPVIYGALVLLIGMAP